MKSSILIPLIALISLTQADITSNLKAHYSLQGSLSDSQGNPDLENQGASLTTDRFGNENNAYHLVEDNDVLIVPNSAFNGVVDYTMSIWVKAEVLTKQESCLFSVANQYSAWLNLLTVIQTQLWLSSAKSGWSFSRFNYGSSLFTGNWQHITIVRDSAANQIRIYNDGVLFFTHDNTAYEDLQPLLVEGFVIGNEQNGSLNSGFYSMYQFHGKLSDFRIYDRALSQADITELYNNDSSAPVDQDTCINYLAALYPATITEDMSFPLNTAENEYYHDYTIKFNEFTYDEDCFDSQLWIGTNSLDFTIADNEIHITFPWKDAAAQGCEQLTPTQQQCQFKLLIFWNGDLQHKKLFTSTINTPDLTDLTQSLTFDVINDEDEDLKSFDQTIESSLQFCSDITCSSYSTPSEIIRNTDVYVEFKVDTPGYNLYYPIHKMIKLNDYNVGLQNEAAVSSWNEQGRIIYHFRPPFASNSIVLAVGISLSQTSPVRRFLSEEEYPQGGQAPVFESQKDNVGKYLRIKVVDVEKDQKVSQSNQVQAENGDDGDNTMIYVGCAAAGVVLVVSLSIVFVCYKVKMAKQAADLVPSSENNANQQQQGRKLSIQQELVSQKRTSGEAINVNVE